MIGKDQIDILPRERRDELISLADLNDLAIDPFNRQGGLNELGVELVVFEVEN